MEAQQRFENFWTALQSSNAIWFDLIKVKFGKKDLRDIAQKLLIELYAEGYNGKNIDWKQVQNRYSKMLVWANDKDVVIAPPKAEPCVIHPDALTGEARDAKIKEVLAEIARSEQHIASRVNPYQGMTAHLNPKDGQKYRPLPAEEIYRRDRHLEYVKYCFDPKTAQKNSRWMEESIFNELFDNNEL